jgi:hypothetical protein
MYDDGPLKGIKPYVKVNSTLNEKQHHGNCVTYLQFNGDNSQLIVASELKFINVNVYSSVIVSLCVKSSSITTSHIFDVVLGSIPASLSI